MCYRDDVPSLELENIHLACLCGDNGHGKTALLDAMTWALWGQARARTQDELIHQGQQDMAVELDFAARDQRYRVSRKHSRSGGGRQGATLLELQVSSGNGYRPITGNTIKETEARIKDLVHLDYDTFVNTAFLLQGQADMFTRSSPAKRKEALAEVLDLSYYQALEERAKDKSKSICDRTKDTEGAISLRQEELALKPGYEARQAEIDAALDTLNPQVESQRASVDQARGSVDSLKAMRNESETLGRRLEAGGGEMQSLQSQLLGHEGRVAEYESAIRGESEIREAFACLQKAKADLERLDQSALQAGNLDREKAALRQSIAVQGERLSAQVDQWRKRIDQELKPQSARVPELEEALRVVGGDQTRLDESSEQINKDRQQAQDVAARVTYLDKANATLKTEMEETRRNFDILDQGQADCPVCKQPLGTEGREHLRAEYEAQGRMAKESYQQQEVESQAQKLKHKELATRLAAQEAEFERRRRDLQVAHATGERDLAESRRAETELESAVRELDSIEHSVRAESFASEERVALASLDAESSALDYDLETHRLAQQEVKSLEPQAELHRKLMEALEALPREREVLEAARQSLARRQEESLEDRTRLTELQSKLASLPGLGSDLHAAESALRDLDSRKRETEVQRGVVIEQLQRLERLETEFAELKSSLGSLVDQKAVYDELVVAFGRNGIQALVIETAIPQLQDDANELLGRLTENRMSLKLQLQEGRRERRMGIPSEELEIKIADEVGTRSYETFSGGEAFRINFALRIALSKLLARRSGAPLPILFIDEGFGSQDYTGQERLKEAIQSIQSDFQKIIVITHVDQVKESFPTRIEVTKTGAGSTFVVV